MMNIGKIEPLLCLAFQGGEGPFDVIVWFHDVKENATLSRGEIFNMSEWDEVSIIMIAEPPQKERRWRTRT